MRGGIELERIERIGVDTAKQHVDALKAGDGADMDAVAADGEVVALAAASATFHAVEYLALVTFYAWRRQDVGSDGMFRQMAQRWVGALAVYVVVLGLLAVAAEAHLREWWVGMNLWAAFLHYAYDGMIWKLRRPETARALGAT